MGCRTSTWQNFTLEGYCDIAAIDFLIVWNASTKYKQSSDWMGVVAVCLEDCCDIARMCAVTGWDAAAVSKQLQTR
jgi:hypothetical protein